MTLTLFSPNDGQHDGELGLLFGSGGRRGAGSGAGNGNGGGGGDAELVFHRLDELGELEDGHRRDLVENFSLDCGHVVLLDVTS